MKWVIRTSITAFLAIWLFVVMQAFANAQTRVEIPIDTVRHGAPGDLFHEGTVEAVGDCTATLRWTNNEIQSQHGGTDILVGATLTFTDVEFGAFMTSSKTFVGTGPTEVFTRLGEDGVSSGGFTLEITCNPPTTTTSTTTPSTTTTTAPPVATTTTTISIPDASTTTTEPPPINGIDTGGGALEHLVSVDPTPSNSVSPWTFVFALLGGILVGAAIIFVGLFMRARRT